MLPKMTALKCSRISRPTRRCAPFPSSCSPAAAPTRMHNAPPRSASGSSSPVAHLRSEICPSDSRRLRIQEGPRFHTQRGDGDLHHRHDRSPARALFGRHRSARTIGIAERALPDLIVLDGRMPDAFTVLQQLKKNPTVKGIQSSPSGIPTSHCPASMSSYMASASPLTCVQQRWRNWALKSPPSPRHVFEFSPLTVRRWTRVFCRAMDNRHDKLLFWAVHRSHYHQYASSAA